MSPDLLDEQCVLLDEAPRDLLQYFLKSIAERLSHEGTFRLALHKVMAQVPNESAIAMRPLLDESRIRTQTLGLLSKAVSDSINCQKKGLCTPQ